MAWKTAVRKWLTANGLDGLAVAGLVALAATASFVVSSTMRGFCEDCNTWLLVPAAILDTIGFLLLLVGIGMAGQWIGQLSHKTWQDKWTLRRDRVDEDQAKVIDSLLQPDGHFSQIQARARSAIWISGPAGLVSLALLLVSMDTFGNPSFATAYTLPLAALSSVICVAGTLRGILLMAGTRPTLRPLRETAAN